MKTTENTILITGGSTGIGYAMAKAFSEAGNEVIICGRNEDKLKDAQRKIPRVHIRACDVENKQEREDLFQWVVTNFPRVNVLVNNAGIQKEIDFSAGATLPLEQEREIEINFAASIHLCALFVPYFLRQKTDCAILNVTSGLAFIPLKIVPVYCATKAGLRAFTISLRSQLDESNIRVFEIAPPIVKTELHPEARARKQSDRGIAPEVVAAATLKAIRNDTFELIIGEAKSLKWASRIAPQLFHKLLNKLAAG
jgi:uncharacterized oxidoreductase